MAKRRSITLKKTACALLLILALQTINLLWGGRYWLNLSSSVPVGLYRQEKFHGPLRRGELVIMSVPQEFRSYIYGRGWMPEDWMLFKEAGAVPGDLVCVFDSHFTVNGEVKGPVYATDNSGLPLPRLRGCQQVPEGRFLPVAIRVKNSFDGRYTGPVEVTAIRGIAKAMLTGP